jgi:uncharacterized protein involved in copper resistance
MLRRLRLVAVRWLFLCAFMQVAAPAQAAIMCGRACAEMAAAVAAAPADMPCEHTGDMSHMGMAGMGMSGMDMGAMPGMDHGHAAGGDQHQPGDHHSPCCDDQCCSAGFARLVAPPPPLLSVPAPPREVAEAAWRPEDRGPAPAARARLRPAIRAPPAA